MIKRCTRCKEIKSCDDFHRNRNTKDGRTSQCKVCVLARYWADPEKARARTATWRLANPDKRWMPTPEQKKRYKAKRRAVEGNLEKDRQTSAAWKIRNQERVKQQYAAWYAINRDRKNEKRAVWRAANAEALRIKNSEWHRNNRERAALKTRRRNERKAGASGRASPEQLAARIAYYGGLCYVCSKPYEAIDHVIPLARGGTGWPANLRPVCNLCNSRKKDRMPPELARRRLALIPSPVLSATKGT